MKARVKMTSNFPTFFTKTKDFFRKGFVSSSNWDSWVGRSKSYHVFTMAFLYDKIRKHLFAKIVKAKSSDDPIKDLSFKFFGRGRSSCSGFSATEIVEQPINETFVGVRNLQNSTEMVVQVAIIGFPSKNANVKTTLSINDTSKVSKMKGSKFFKNVRFPCSHGICFSRLPYSTTLEHLSPG